MIIRPEVLPEEHAPGYLGRVMVFNGLSNFELAIQTLMKWSGNAGKSRRTFTTVELLAKVAGIDSAQFVCAHTALPLRRAIASRRPQVEHGCSSQRSLLWSTSLRNSRPGAYLCSKCVEEDYEIHGMPYWRREHQLSGHFFCVKHELPLGYVETPGAFLSPPSAFHNDHRIVDRRWAAKLQRSQAVQSFLAITSDLLSRAKPLDERDVSRIVRARALGLGLHGGRGAVRRELVSDLVVERFDREWLATVVPELLNKQVGQFSASVDRTVIGQHMAISATIYAVVFAALFETPDQAINAMLSRPPDSERARRRRKWMISQPIGSERPAPGVAAEPLRAAPAWA